MKILKLKLKNIKCFKDVEISFRGENGNIRNWSLIAGDNGHGKTTLLRSLAIGLCDRGGADALLKKLHGGFLMQGETEGFIEITLIDEVGDKKPKEIITKIKLAEGYGSEYVFEQQVRLASDNSSEYVPEQPLRRVSDSSSEYGYRQDGGDKLDRKKLFAVAYGAGRDVTGTESYDEYDLVDSTYSLFNYESRLHNAELAARRIYAEKEWDEASELLKRVFMLDSKDKIDLDKKGLYVESSQWGKVYFNALSDGYRALGSVILDCLGWKLLSVNDGDFSLKEISGIFIIDEIEQHLHPRWQREIISTLSSQFPDMQFIGSTHTPICALGLNDLRKCESQLVKATYVNGYSEVESFDLRRDYKGYRSDQILTSEIFDLSDTRSKYIEGRLNKHREICLIEERSEEQQRELDAIEEELKGLPMWDNQQDRVMREKLIKILKNKQRGNSSD